MPARTSTKRRCCGIASPVSVTSELKSRRGYDDRRSRIFAELPIAMQNSRVEVDRVTLLQFVLSASNRQHQFAVKQVQQLVSRMHVRFYLFGSQRLKIS